MRVSPGNFKGKTKKEKYEVPLVKIFISTNIVHNVPDPNDKIIVIHAES